MRTPCAYVRTEITCRTRCVFRARPRLMGEKEEEMQRTIVVVTCALFGVTKEEEEEKKNIYNKPWLENNRCQCIFYTLLWDRRRVAPFTF